MSADQGAAPDMIWVSSIVSQRTREGLVQVQWGGKACQLSVAEARQLGMQMLECAEAAESDAGILHVISEKVGADERIAYSILLELRAFRDQKEKKGKI